MSDTPNPSFCEYGTKIRISERKAKQITEFLFSFPSVSIFAAQQQSTIKRAKNQKLFWFFRVTNWATHKMNPRISIMPSLRLGDSNHSHLSFIRRGLNPNPRPFPSLGEGMQPLASARSVIKVSATHQRVAGRLLTQQSCDCLCGLRPPFCQKVTQCLLHNFII